MKGILIAIFATAIGVTAQAQTDSTKHDHGDTIRVGGMIIIKKPGKDSTGKSTDVTINRHRKYNGRVTTNWWIVDLGFSNFSDETNYAATAASGVTGPGVNKEAMKLRAGKSVNVNIWMFMQRLNIVKHVVNLKYGLGVELNNYRFENTSLILEKDPPKIMIGSAPAGKTIEKNKLAADYVTVPLMLNFNFTPNTKNGFGFSAGVSGGYLYSARQKFKYSDDSKNKTHGDFDLNKWKVSYIAELSLGPVRLYGSMATKSMWENGLDQTPYNIGVRMSHL